MRKLNKKQKDLCIKYLKEGGNPYNINYSLKLACEKINDYETLYQDIDRFVSDYDFNLNR